MWIGQYILDENGDPQPEPDSLKWAAWFEQSGKSEGKDNRFLAHDHIGSVLVSTVFLGLDHSFMGSGGGNPPVLWETMVFQGEHDQYQKRYRSRADALAGHDEAVEMVKSSQADLQELERMADAGGWLRK